MEVIELRKNLLRFVFPPQPGKGKEFGFNIFAFLGENQSLLLDTGFKEHAEAVKEWLTGLGLPPRQAIISHFHADHIFGLKALRDVRVLGSGRFQETLDLYLRPETHALFTPHRLVADGERITFGDFQLRFVAMPGHAACNLYTIIDERFIHVGDDVSASNEGRAFLPTVELFRIGDHIASLEKLKEYAGLTFLLSHGPLIDDKEEILTIIDNRLRYLNAVAASGANPIPVEEALAGCTTKFIHQEWHAYLYQED